MVSNKCTFKARICIRPHRLTRRMHHKPQRQEVISFYIQALFFSYCCCFCSAYVCAGGVDAFCPLIPSPLPSIPSQTSFLLQNGGDGGTTAAHRPGGLVGFKGCTSDRSEPQRRPSHPRYVIETARFLVAGCFKEIMYWFLVHYCFVFLDHV